MIELIVKKEDREINRYFLPQGITTLGRAEDNSIILDDSCVSRRHARIKVEGAKITIEDLGSGNGTFYAEERVERQELKDGDEVVIEPFRLVLKKEKAEQRVDSTRPVPAGAPKPSTRLDSSSPRQSRQPGGSAAGGPRLEVVRGTGGPYLLTEEEGSIGRSDEAKITLKDASASRKHASIEKTRKGWVVRDLESANGTFVNGATVRELVLTDGDIILIGNTELRFVDPAASAHDAPVTPPPSTRPVPKSGRRPQQTEDEPPPRRSPARGSGRAAAASAGMEMGGDFEMEMGGDFDGGAMPSDPSTGGGTELGAPPSAFGDGYGGDATGEGYVDNNNGYGGADGGYGMELGQDALFPGGGRPPESLLARYIISLKTNPRTRLITVGLGLVFGIIILGKSQQGSGGGPSRSGGYVSQLDKQQQLTLQTMETFKRDAEAALRSEPKDFVTAFDRYGRIVQFSQKSEMTRVIDAERLGATASDAIYTMHEALVIQKLRETTSKGQQKDLATQRRIDKGMKDGQTALGRAKKFRSVNEYTKAINAFSDVLQVDPDNSDAKTMLTEARQEKGKIVGVMSAQALERLKAETAKMFNQGLALKNRRTAKGYQDAINTFQNVLRKDDEGQTEWYAKANAEIGAAKKKLKDIARPLRDQGKAAYNKADWLAARKAYRNAVATDPFDPTLVAELDAAQVECIKSAKRQISEGKAYAAADNYSEAMTSLKLALVYADRGQDKEHLQAQELIKQIKRNTER